MEEKIKVEISIDKNRLGEWEDYVKRETRSEEIAYKENPEGDYIKEWKIGDEKIRIGIKRIMI